MRTILYCRVSSDEQAKGASLEVQESYLRSYCVNHGYEVVGIYKEDYSAKHHDLRRPQFKTISKEQKVYRQNTVLTLG